MLPIWNNALWYLRFNVSTLQTQLSLGLQAAIIPSKLVLVQS
jgi:hypothetical protein